jgi:hypothetical protein
MAIAAGITVFAGFATGFAACAVIAEIATHGQSTPAYPTPRRLPAWGDCWGDYFNTGKKTDGR